MGFLADSPFEYEDLINEIFAYLAYRFRSIEDDRWITGRDPDAPGWYLTTTRCGGGRDDGMLVVGERAFMPGTFAPESPWASSDPVLAWKPLPDAYVPGGEE